jgi:hypothetical protein
VAFVFQNENFPCFVEIWFPDSSSIRTLSYDRESNSLIAPPSIATAKTSPCWSYATEGLPRKRNMPWMVNV